MTQATRGKGGESAGPPSDQEAARAAIERYLESLDALREQDERSGPRPRWHQPQPDQWTISLIGSSEQTINVELSLGGYTLQLVSFFMRGPDVNVADVHRLLLRRNLELSTIKFGIDEFGDIFLRADLPNRGVTENDLDRTIGSLYACADASYLPVMRLGFEDPSAKQ